jgi:hypothetical protein
MGKNTINLSKKLDTGLTIEETLAQRRMEEIEEMRFELVKSAIAGLAMSQLDYPGRQAMNAVALADACMKELGVK